MAALGVLERGAHVGARLAQRVDKPAPTAPAPCRRRRRGARRSAATRRRAAWARTAGAAAAAASGSRRTNSRARRGPTRRRVCSHRRAPRRAPRRPRRRLRPRGVPARPTAARRRRARRSNTSRANESSSAAASPRRPAIASHIGLSQWTSRILVRKVRRNVVDARQRDKLRRQPADGLAAQPRGAGAPREPERAEVRARRLADEAPRIRPPRPPPSAAPRRGHRPSRRRRRPGRARTGDRHARRAAVEQPPRHQRVVPRRALAPRAAVHVEDQRSVGAAAALVHLEDALAEFDLAHLRAAVRSVRAANGTIRAGNITSSFATSAARRAAARAPPRAPPRLALHARARNAANDVAGEPGRPCRWRREAEEAERIENMCRRRAESRVNAKVGRREGRSATAISRRAGEIALASSPRSCDGLIYRQPSVTRLAGAHRPLRRSRPSTATQYQPQIWAAATAGSSSRAAAGRAVDEGPQEGVDRAGLQGVGAAAAIKKAPVPQADEQLKRQLAAAEAEAANYKQMTRDAALPPRAAAARAALGRREAAGRAVGAARGEARARARDGRAQVCAPGAAHLGRLQADLSTAQRELSAEHDRAERLSAKLVAEANAALLDENAAAEGSAHPVFGELLHDFGHKRLYRASPLTLWTGTVLWDSQRLPPGARRAHRQVEDALDRRRLARRHLRRPRGSTRGRARQRQPQRRRALHQRRA